MALARPGDHGSHAVSSRIYDAINIGAINIFLGSTILQQTIGFKTLIPAIPWANMSIVVDPMTFWLQQQQAIETAIAAAEQDSRWLSRALDLTAKHAADILWTHPHSRVAENVLRACQQRQWGLDGCIEAGLNRSVKYRQKHLEAETC